MRSTHRFVKHLFGVPAAGRDGETGFCRVGSKWLSRCARLHTLATVLSKGSVFNSEGGTFGCKPSSFFARKRIPSELTCRERGFFAIFSQELFLPAKFAVLHSHAVVIIFCLKIARSTINAVLRLSAALALACGGARASALSWTRTTEERTVERGTPFLDLKYHFRNQSAKAVQIESVETSCRCTTAAFAKAAYAPGEEGDLDVSINLIGRTEGEEKTITVMTSDSRSPTVLTLKVEMSAPWKVSPHLLSWREGEAPVEKGASILLDRERQVSVRISSSDSTKVDVHLRESTDGSGETLTVTPTSTGRQFVTSIELEFESPVSGKQSLLVYAQVR